MEPNKDKQKVDYRDTQNSSGSEYNPTDFMESPPPKKKRNMRRKKKQDVMPLESTKKGVSQNPKKLKSKDKQQESSTKYKKSDSNVRKRARYTDVYEDIEAKFSVMERAERVRAHLDTGIPHFVKCMLPSNVSHGFWLHLPKKFCNHNLPNEDTSIVLVDEWGNEYKTSYLLGRHGLSAGWRCFAISHRLMQGDILIFHLTDPCKLKVHIVRVNGIDVIDAALCLMNLEACWRRTDSELMKKDKRKRKKTKYLEEPFLVDISRPMGNDGGENAQHSVLVPDRAGTDITNQPQPKEQFYTRTPFLHDHAREGVTCR